MKKFLIVLVLVLSGCVHEIYEWQLISAERACISKGGVDHLDTRNPVGVICKNGAYFTLIRGT